jgi:hypothetical protein
MDNEITQKLKVIIQYVGQRAGSVSNEKESAKQNIYLEFIEYENYYKCFYAYSEDEKKYEMIIIPKKYLKLSYATIKLEYLYQEKSSIPFPNDIDKARKLFEEYIHKGAFKSIASYELCIEPEFKWSYIRIPFFYELPLEMWGDTFRSIPVHAERAAFGFISYIFGKGEEGLIPCEKYMTEIPPERR